MNVRLSNTLRRVAAPRIVSSAQKSSDDIFGVAFLSAEGTGAYGNVFYDSVERLDRDWHVGLTRVLGHVMAHELGHLLLGSNAHSRQGIVCPRWHEDELRLASMGALLFSEEQAQFMRERLVRYVSPTMNQLCTCRLRGPCELRSDSFCLSANLGRLGYGQNPLLTAG
jgi:hypothetical protein